LAFTDPIWRFIERTVSIVSIQRKNVRMYENLRLVAESMAWQRRNCRDSYIHTFLLRARPQDRGPSWMRVLPICENVKNVGIDQKTPQPSCPACKTPTFVGSLLHGSAASKPDCNPFAGLSSRMWPRGLHSDRAVNSHPDRRIRCRNVREPRAENRLAFVRSYTVVIRTKEAPARSSYWLDLCR
jgi:hypothetical protein